MRWLIALGVAVAACAGTAHPPAPLRVGVADERAILAGDGTIRITLQLAPDPRRPAIRAVDWELIVDRPVARGRIDAPGARLEIALTAAASARVLARAQETGEPIALDALLHFDGGAARLELPALLLQGDETNVLITR